MPQAGVQPHKRACIIDVLALGKTDAARGVATCGCREQSGDALPLLFYHLQEGLGSALVLLAEFRRRPPMTLQRDDRLHQRHQVPARLENPHGLPQKNKEVSR